VKKGLLIYRINRDDPANLGVIKKSQAQQKAFEENGISVDRLWLCKDGVLLNEDLILQTNLPPHSLKVYQFYFFRFGTIIKQVFEKGNYDFIYLRHPFFDPLLVQSLRKIKSSIPSTKILLEINTYPYDAEPKRLLHKWSLKMDQHYRKGAKEYIDRIIDYGQRETIWNIPAISVRNGIDVNEIPLSKSKPVDGKLRLIAVGNWSYWHGLDRVIAGMNQFYKQGGKGISLKIIGAGEALEDLTSYVIENKLKDFIVFKKPLQGVSLDKEFEDADIGIGTIGMHRKQVALNFSLKHRDYCARGIPFILGGEDPDFPKELSFVKYVKSDDSEISMEGLQSFFTKMKETNKKERRVYAEQQLTWKKKIAELIKLI